MSESVFQAPSVDTMNQLLPSLEFIGLLSSNAVGAVYYASQKSLDRDVAVKIFCPNLSSQEEFRSHFVGSASSMATLRHPNLIGVYDSGTVEGMSYVVIEFVPGKSLWRSTQGHAIEFGQAMSLIGEICEGMACAHERKIVHGYLSPLDILLNQKASPKIGNFGLGLTVHTLADVAVPTHFTAPEVLEGFEPTEASDLYSLAAIFYELITGNPYRPGGPSASELEGTPRAVDQVIERAGASDPALRDMTPAEFFEQLKQASQRRSAAAGARPGPGAPARPGAPALPAAMAAAHKEEKKVLGKVVIILLLLIAIQQVWSHRGIVLSRGQESRDGDADVEEVRNVQVNPPRVIQRPTTPSRPTPPQPDPGLTGFPENAETPMDSLARLQDRLAQGRRDELPLGTVSAGASHYFLVTQAMSWPEAVAYAEKHGGHLALPSGDMSWREQEPIQGEAAWIGAARSGAQFFTALDGRPWSPSSSVGGSGPYVMLDRNGGFQSAGPTVTKPFVIEWLADGGNPATLEKRLAATADSLKGSRPVYPPGTVAEGERHYLPVVRATTWEQARALAESAGGMLAVLSDDQELDQWQRAAAQCPASRQFWTGGHLAGDHWQWVSSEPWRAVAWLSRDQAARDNAAMFLRAGTGVDAQDKNDELAGFLIEWSRDPETNRATQSAGLTVAEELSQLTARAAQLVVKAGEDKEEAHRKNTDKVAWDLDAHMRGLNRSAQQALAPEVEKLKGCVRDNRLLKETVEAEGVALNVFMAKLCNYVIGKQAEIDEQYTTSLQVIQTSYRTKLIELRDQASKAGQIRIETQIEGLLEDSSHLDNWVAAMKTAAGGL